MYIYVHVRTIIINDVFIFIVYRLIINYKQFWNRSTCRTITRVMTCSIGYTFVRKRRRGKELRRRPLKIVRNRNVKIRVEVDEDYEKSTDLGIVSRNYVLIDNKEEMIQN